MAVFSHKSHLPKGTACRYSQASLSGHLVVITLLIIKDVICLSKMTP